jgi:hypothetical protein
VALASVVLVGPLAVFFLPRDLVSRFLKELCPGTTPRTTKLWTQHVAGKFTATSGVGLKTGRARPLCEIRVYI